MGYYRGEGKNTRVFSETERKAALELAAAIGVSAAARHLGVARKSVYRWAEEYAQFWSDLRAGDPQASRRRIAQNLEDLADRYSASEHDLLERIEGGGLKPTNAKEAAALLKAMGSSRQAAIAGSRTVSGEPEHVEHTIDFPALEQAMERLLGGTPAAPQLPLQVENEAEHVDAVSTDDA